ncbi:AGC/PKA protein kinase [Colletotrichum scovillei]|uniref:AGC/PKA protein kinase n=1 Tax=Colletotrichum scovillei TaxID=1209932 RepID=UPI0015C32EB3|nr:AGC/PKA protein kinase [Colletotrichum scovillei]KAF4784642.1 AGC/PKA protein kinase [Colletotrichum scovillei]
MDEVHGTLGELGQAVENLRDDSRSTAEGIRDQLQRKAEAEDRRVVLDWVSTRTFVLEQTDLLNLRYEGTGTWFLECRNFKTWSSYTGSEERYRILFCLGGMGAGKTIITATVVDYLRSKYRGRSDIALAYVYCDYKNRSLDTSATLLRSILRQIVEALPSSPTEFNKMHERKDPLPSTVVKKLLRDTIKMIPSCIIVIDAIDELEVFVSNERASMLDIIDDLRRQPNVKLFLTSRPISTISYQFKPTNSLIQEVRAEIQDLETYLGQRIQKLSPLLRRHLELQKKVKDAIIGIVDGMDDLTVAAVNRRLTELQRDAHIAQSTPNSGDDWKHRLLCKAYDNVLDRIKTQEHDSVAMKALMWITYAKRPLKVPELVEAIAAGLHHERLAKDNMYEREDIVPACGGLVVVDETSGVVRLSHYSAQEYFEKTCFPEAHYEISGVCAAYLILYERPDCQSGLGPSSFNRVSAAHERTTYEGCDDNIHGLENVAELLEYARDNWSKHVHQSQATMLHGKVQELLAMRSYAESLAGFDAHDEASPLHVAAALGIDIAVAQIISENKDTVHIKDAKHQTPLCYALLHGHESTVRTLLAGGARSDASFSLDKTGPRLPMSMPLVTTMRIPSARLFHILLDTSQAYHNWRALSGKLLIEACFFGHISFVSALLSRGVDPNCIEEIHCGETISPLLIAACADTGTPDIVQELLSDERIEVDLQVGFACTPRTVLSHAVERNLEAIVERLLAGKARVYDKLPRKVSKNKRFPSTSHLDALDGAVVQGNPHIMEMVFQQAPDFDFKSSKGRYLTCTAAYFASLNGLRFLLDNGVEVDGADTTGKTPLFYTMKGLKSYNSDATCNDPDAAGDDYKKTYKWFLRMNDTPSEQTMFERARESAQLLIQNGARIDLGDKHGRTALSYAVHKPEYARLCLQLQASVNSKDFIGRTPLSHASQVRGNEPVVEMLLGHGADPTSKDIVGRTPLWFAVQAQSSGNVRLLISSCKDSSLIVSKDIFGKNPITMSLADVIGTDCVPSYFEELLCFNADSSEGPKILDQPMLLAAKYGQKKIYEKLLEKADSIGYHVPLQLDSFARD